MLLNFSAILIFIIISVFFLLSLLFLNFMVFTKKKSSKKNEIFECGEPTIGNTKVKINGHFFNIALVYILFDVEIALLVPIVIAYKNQINNSNPIFMFSVLLFFLLFLIIGFIYEWLEGNFDWIKNN